MNIFFWHYTIDRIEQFSPWYNAGAVLMATCLLFAAWRELHLAEKHEASS